MFDFDTPQFTTQELLACVPGLTHDGFKQWLKRNVLLLTVHDEIGRGKRPKYRGIDVVQVAFAYEIANNSAVPLYHFKSLWFVISGAINGVQFGLRQPNDLTYFFYTDRVTEELKYIGGSSENPPPEDAFDGPEVPDTMTMFRVDRFIGRMVKRLERIKAGLPADEPLPPPTSGDLAVDDEGRRVFVGLTHAESIELAELSKVNAPTADQQRRRDMLEFLHQEAKRYRMFSCPLDHNRADWTKDESGRDVMLGLTADETQEFARLTAKTGAAHCVHTYFPWEHYEDKEKDEQREMYLIEKHKNGVFADMAKPKN
jgi:hypothetical protein